MDQLISLESQLDKQPIGVRVEMLAEDLIKMENESEELQFHIKERKKQLVQAMNIAGLKNITAKSGHKITLIEKKNFEINAELAEQIIESECPKLKMEFYKLNDAEFRKTFPTCEAIKEKSSTQYVKVEKK